MNNVHHTLLQRRDGTYELVVWLETSDWNETSNVEIQPAAQSITVNVPLAVTSATLTTVGTTGAASSAPLPISNGAMTVNAADTVSIVTFKT